MYDAVRRQLCYVVVRGRRAFGLCINRRGIVESCPVLRIRRIYQERGLEDAQSIGRIFTVCYAV